MAHYYERRVDPQIAAAIERLPPEFGLRGHAGTFRVSRDSSYMAGDLRSPRVMLYTEKKQSDGSWSDFAKGSPEELAEQVIPLRGNNRASSNYASDAAYDQRSKSESHAESIRIARNWAALPPSDRREIEADFLDALKDTSLIGERVRWLVDGNYGRGLYLTAREVLRNTRMNREAWLVQAIGTHEWHVPQANVSRIWKRLTPTQQKALDRAMKAIIREPFDS